MENLIEIAVITRPQGVKGELRLTVFLDNNDDIFKFNEVFIENEKNAYKVLDCKKVSNDFSIKLEGIDSYDSAMKFKNKSLLARREDVDKLKDENNVYIADLIGKSAVLNDGEFIGIIDNVENYGASDVVFIRSKKYENLSFANIGGIILNIDYEKQEVILDKDRFFSVCVYDGQDEN